MNILIYYNPNCECYYLIYSDYIPDRPIGYKNSYNHVLVQILANRHGELYSVTSKYDLAKIPRKKENLKLRLINVAIHWLNKSKKRIEKGI